MNAKGRFRERVSRTLYIERITVFSSERHPVDDAVTKAMRMHSRVFNAIACVFFAVVRVVAPDGRSTATVPQILR